MLEIQLALMSKLIYSIYFQFFFEVKAIKTSRNMERAARAKAAISWFAQDLQILSLCAGGRIV